MMQALQLPINPYSTGEYHVFGHRLRRRFVLWATHLGDDVVGEPGTAVAAIGDGDVVWSEMRLGSAAKRNWGGIIIVEHHNDNFQFSIFNFQKFYSVYGHIRDLSVNKGDQVSAGQRLGVIAPGSTPENGWWQTPHLHFAIYTGPWQDRVLPGYWRPDDWLRLSPRRTRLKWWHDPRDFINTQNSNFEARNNIK